LGQCSADTAGRPHPAKLGLDRNEGADRLARSAVALAANGEPAAAAAFLSRRLSTRLPVAVGYVPKGPALDWSDTELAGQVLQRIQEEARRRRAIFVKIDPDVRADATTGQVVQALLVQRGWRASDEQIQYRNTMITDLTPDEETLLAGMKPKWRYNIRLSARRGVVVRDGTSADLPGFYGMYAETGERDGFLVRPYPYYESIWSRFMMEDLAHLLLAELDGELVAGLILFRFGGTAWYFYGASTAVGREAMPNHALQWAALCWAKAAGCTRYDWWGAPDKLEEGDPMWGCIASRRVRGRIHSLDRRLGLPHQPPLYWLYTVAMPRFLQLARKRHRAGLTER